MVVAPIFQVLVFRLVGIHLTKALTDLRQRHNAGRHQRT